VRKHKCGSFTPTGKNFVSHVVDNGFAVRAPLLLLCKRQTKSQNRHSNILKKSAGTKAGFAGALFNSWRFWDLVC
jgi:hypothetical protein